MMRILFFVLVCQASWAATPFVVKDLRTAWQVYTDEGYVRLGSLPEEELHAIYIELMSSNYPGQQLSLANSEPWTLFINGKLICSGTARILSLDSLSTLYGPGLWIGVYSATAVGELQTKIVRPGDLALRTSETMLPKPPGFFRNYSILATALLLIFLLVLFRTNPQLTLDYFSFAKIFSVQERNENLLASRITSSVNFLFYLFCALLTGLLLSAVFYVAGTYFPVSRFVSMLSLGDAFWIWLKLSFYILLLLTSKLIVVLLFSSLFNFRETVSFQFFNFLRFVLFTAVVMAILTLVYFIFHGRQPLFYKQLIVLALALMSAGSVMVLLKLLARAPFSFFHLFSYLCISEIIPLVIIIKIFF